MGDLSAHFSKSEFKCHHCGKLPANTPPTAFVLALERLRAVAYPGGLVIVSGYRCPEWNKEVGGKPDSRHLHGDAADIVGRVGVQTAQRLGFRGVGYQGRDGLVVHVDMRPNPATWAYDAFGNTP